MAQYQPGRQSILIGVALLCRCISSPPMEAAPVRARSGNPLQVLKGLPLVFEPNLGQTHPEVRFLTRAPGITSFFTARENVMVLSRMREHDPSKRTQTAGIEQTVVRMTLEGSRTPLRFEGLERTESTSSYFIGNDPSKWAPNVPHYHKVRAHNVYPGIDLVYYGGDGQLEYDFVVSPNADPTQIRLAYKGAESLTTDADGNLLIMTVIGTLVQRRPVVYQEVDGKRREVKVAYSIRAGKVEFALADWDRRRELVIDPVLAYSTYLGGSALEYGYGIAVDASGAAYVTGRTDSVNFPTAGGFQPAFGGARDAFVTKLNAAGTALIYSTYLGGNSNDYGLSVAVDSAGNAYVAGQTYSSNFPTTPGSFRPTIGNGSHIFVTKLNAFGSALVYSTYLGGSGFDAGYGIAVDASGAAYVTGETSSTDFPTTAGAFQPALGGGDDAFVSKLNPAGAALDYSTYLGGSNGEVAYSIALDGVGNAYVTGSTASTDFPVTPGAYQTSFGGTQDVFLSKLNPTGAMLIYSTYVGGSGFDVGNSVAVDPSGAAYITGVTESTNFPTTSSAYQTTFGGILDAFVTKVNPAGAALAYSTYLSGSGVDVGSGITVDVNGAAYVTGETLSADFPVTACAYQMSFGGIADAFVTKLNSAGNALLYSTYLGGSDEDAGHSIAVDPTGLAYVTGFTASPDFPTTSGSFQVAYGGGSYDALVTKLGLTTPAPSAIAAVAGSPQSTAVGTAFSVPLQVKVTDVGGNPVGGVVVTFTVPGSTASAALSSSKATTDCSGLASVTATANMVAGTYEVTAAVGTVANATFRLTNTAGTAQVIAFVQQPADTTAGSAITPPVVILLVDDHNNPIGGATIVLALENGAGSLHGALTHTTDATGHANFGDLSISVVGTYNLQATAGGLTAISNSFKIIAGSANSIVVSAGDGQTAVVGTAYGAPLEAIVHDAFGNPVSGASVMFSTPASGAGVTFGGAATVTTDGNGIAISPTVTANSQPGSFQVTASTTGAPSAAIFTLNNVAGIANRLTFVQQPVDTVAAAVITPAVTVQLQDSLGNPIHTSGIAVTLQLVPAQVLSGTLTQTTDANGLAAFANLSVWHVGQYELLAEAPSIVSATSHTFNITAGVPATILASGGTPQSAIIHTVFGAPLQVTVTDAAGNPLSGVATVFAAPASGASGLFSGQSTVTVATDAQGHASAGITANGIAGSYGVTASSTFITGSAMFELTNLPVGSSSLAFVQQPTNTMAGQAINPPVTVRVRDASGQPVSVAGVPIVLSLSSGTGTLLGTLVQLTDATGVATFADLRITQTGTMRLRATANLEIPADSDTFQILAGTAATITAISGALQSTTVSQQFPSLMQARVMDSAGNPVNGVAVTFSAPSSGPSGTFAGAVIVTTASNGIATAPPLTANNQPGNFTVTATAAGVISQAVFALTNLPQQSSTLLVDPAQLTFANEINQSVPPGKTVQIIGAGGSLVSWTASASAPWLSASPASGTTPGQMTVSVNPAGLAPGTYTGSIRLASPNGGVALVLVTYTIADKPALVITPHTLVFTTNSNIVTPGAQTLTATSTSRTIAYRLSTHVSTPSGGAWLQVSSSQGQTTGTVQVSVSPAGLGQGVYDGSVVFTPVESGVNSVAVPVTLIVGCGEGGCLVQPHIISVVNGASFQPGGAPGAAMTIFGAGLADATYQAASFPLPTQLGSTTVTVNGEVTPLYYASPTQINFQMPFSAPSAAIQVVVNNQAANGGRALRASEPHTSTLAVVDPGLFVTTDRRAAALNADLTTHTAATPIAAADYVLLFLTGQGSVTPAVAAGIAAPASPLSLINARVQVTIGGENAVVAYQGLAPGFAGLAQLNVVVPSGLAAGNQPVFVTINGVPSNAAVITVK